MMPIAELVAVARTLDDCHRSPLGDEAAARWGYGAALFIRSSASHVFVGVPPVNGKRIVLRMRPETDPDAEEVLLRSAEAAAALKAAGAPVAGSVASAGGHLVERVGGYAVTALAAVEGDPRDSDDIDEDTAWAWGSLLADFHSRGQAVRLDGVPWMPYGTSAPDTLAELPRDPEVHGLLHGDAELDNVVWTRNRGVLVDLDEVRYGWFVADVGFALRDWASPARAPDLTLPVPAAFVAGYRDRRDLTDEELSWLPRFARVSAAETLTRLEPVLAAPARSDWPRWARQLDRKVRDRADEIRRALTAG